jgi:hypothetical protein
MADIIRFDRRRPAPSIAANDAPELSYDECLARLARAVAEPEELGDVARLAGQLAVRIE